MKRKPYWVAAALAALSIPLVATAQAGSGMGEGRMGHARGMHGGEFASNATLTADRTALDEAFTQLRNDVKAGNTSAVAGDQTAITAAVTKLQADRSALMTAAKNSAAVQAAKEALVADHQVLERDRAQLRSDQIAGNEAAVTADKATLAADLDKMRTDRKALADAVAALAI